MPTAPILRLLLLLSLSGCTKPEGVPPAVVDASRNSTQAAPAPPARGPGEYTDMPAPPQGNTTLRAEMFAAEVLRAGPDGEPRLFESAQEQVELTRGFSPKYMNAQFRYYLRGVSLVQPQGECKTPLMAINLVVENLHGAPAQAIRGEFTFTQTVGAEGAQAVESGRVRYQADVLGPFSNKQGGFAYATAYAEPTDAAEDRQRWAKLVAAGPGRLKVWFRPDVFYYADGNQYGRLSGRTPAQRDVVTCAGLDGARPLMK